jgi:NitT/TauT family transport system permease protein
MLPIGLGVGLSEKYTKRLQPLIQTVASFPGSLLFPMLILAFGALKIPLGIGSLVLMMLGTQWYVLFNVVAGARAMPSDLREVAKSFRYNRMQRFRWLYLPAIFPYLVTGIISAAGGAWNASIVAEYVTTKNGVISTPGIGSSISLAAQAGDYPMLTASVLTMVIAVALINYLVWLRLYRYSEERFALNE